MTLKWLFSPSLSTVALGNRYHCRTWSNLQQSRYLWMCSLFCTAE